MADVRCNRCLTLVTRLEWQEHAETCMRQEPSRLPGETEESHRDRIRYGWGGTTVADPLRPYPPIRVGTFVRAVIDHDHEAEYVREARDQRVLYNEMVGEVIGHSDSHGLCYEVRFRPGDNGTAWFEPNELEESV